MTPAEFTAARKSLGLTQAELASALGLSRQASISDMEGGRSAIRPIYAREVQRLLDAHHDLPRAS